MESETFGENSLDQIEEEIDVGVVNTSISWGNSTDERSTGSVKSQNKIKCKEEQLVAKDINEDYKESEMEVENDIENEENLEIHEKREVMEEITKLGNYKVQENNKRGTVNELYTNNEDDSTGGSNNENEGNLKFLGEREINGEVENQKYNALHYDIENNAEVTQNEVFEGRSRICKNIEDNGVEIESDVELERNLEIDEESEGARKNVESEEYASEDEEEENYELYYFRKVKTVLEKENKKFVDFLGLLNSFVNQEDSPEMIYSKMCQVKIHYFFIYFFKLKFSFL